MQAASFGQVLDQIERNQADWGWVPSPFYHDPARGLARKYGGSRYFLAPGWALGGYLLNSHRPLFKNNPRLRRAVNFAVDRKRCCAGGQAGQPTSSCRRESPASGMQRSIRSSAPTCERHELSLGDICASRTAVLYAIDVPNERARAQVLVNNLEKIGLKVDLKTFPPPAYFAQIDNPRAAFDIAGFDWLPDYIDP